MACFAASDSLRISAALVPASSPPSSSSSSPLLLLPRLRLLRLHAYAAQEKAPVHRFVTRVSPVSELVVDGAANAAVATQDLDLKVEEDIVSDESVPVPKEETISSVMADVTSLVKFIDSRDIVELELKHQDYELIIRKKEALEPSPPAQPQVIHSPVMYPSYGVAPSHAPSHNLDSSVAAEATLVEAPKAVSKSASNLPCIASPMAGTFYKSPGPGEPAFVKVGDRVSKGQVICIVEAMKLMNEIESDKSGTVVEILVEDGKPVSIDTPLFAIKP